MAVILDLVISALLEWYRWRKRTRDARPIPKIVGSVPYVPLKR
jgi:hypothetical protein